MHHAVYTIVNLLAERCTSHGSPANGTACDGVNAFRCTWTLPLHYSSLVAACDQFYWPQEGPGTADRHAQMTRSVFRISRSENSRLPVAVSCLVRGQSLWSTTRKRTESMEDGRVPDAWSVVAAIALLVFAAPALAHQQVAAAQVRRLPQLVQRSSFSSRTQRSDAERGMERVLQ